ncbi:macro domain-containing protein [Flavobacterium sp. N1719]|uniref:macro domain-containing protein n=1 Tax=Flavobacterium sp. N1719 TaxID=2885633 RepID=UPI0022229160|nr:macro domain-containing protein [Flavobacterium sp. N1719]
MRKKIITGIRRHPKRFLLAIVFGYTVLWTFFEPLFSILEIKPTGYNCWFLLAYVIASLIISFIVVYPEKMVKFNLTNTNTKVEIVFGDLFTADGHKVISVSEFFDSKIGKPVSPKSLQGIFITKILGGHTNIFDDAVNAQLAGQEIETVQRVDGKSIKYELGTTITINHNQSLYFLFALTNTDNDCNANSTPSLMLKALEGLWNKVRIEGNGIDINLPLIGNGLSRVGLPPSQLLQLTLISLLKSAKEIDLSSTIRIVLTEDMFDKIDLEIIKNNWE